MDKDDFGGFLRFVLMVGILLSVVLSIIAVPMYFQAKYTANVLNNVYGLKATVAQMFWAGDTVENIVLGKRERQTLDATVRIINDSEKEN